MRRLGQTRTRKLIAVLLAIGLVASVSLRAVFSLFLMPTHPLGNVVYSDGPDSWPANVIYSQVYGLSLVAALAFIVALGVLAAPRPALFASFTMLNIYFVWTSHLLSTISLPAHDLLQQVMASQSKFLWINGGLVFFLPSDLVYFPALVTDIVIDLECLALLGILIASTLLLNLDKGVKRAVLLSSQVSGLCLAILGAQIAIFDYNDLFTHVTVAQGMLSFAPWFSNGDLLLSGAAIFAVSTCLLGFGRLRHQRY
jgi:hypothetical protein